MSDLLSKLRYLLSRREKWQAIGLFVLMLGAAGLEMLGVGAIPAFVSLLSNPDMLLKYDAAQAVKNYFDITTDKQFALYAAGGMVLIYVVKNTYRIGLAYAQAHYKREWQVHIASRLFKAYLYSPYTFHLQRNVAELIRNTNSEAQSVVNGVVTPGLGLVREVLVVVAVLFLLLVVDPLVSFLVFLGLGSISFFFYRKIRKHLSSFGKQRQHYRGKMIQSVNEGLGGLKNTKVLGREKHFLQTFTDSASQFTEAAKFKTVMGALPRPFLETAAMIGLLAVAGLSIVQGRPVETIVPTLTLLAVAVVRMIPSFNRITQGANGIRYGRYAVDVVHDDLRDLDAAAAARKREASGKAMPFERALRLDDVSFRYPGADEDALKNISLSIPEGSAVGFVGATGAGKTTMVDLILGLLTPTAGAVRIDERDMQENVRAWQQRIGYIPQDIYLADDTIRHNIAFGIPAEEIDEEAVQRAVESAQLNDFISDLSDGLDAEVGDRGVRLSGGQRQRVGIARALYHNPQVLVMDEATSSLDNETERYVMEAVEELRGDRTLVMIAHRLSTVESCDRLFYLSHGRLEAVGTYEELMATSGSFRQMAAA